MLQYTVGLDIGSVGAKGVLFDGAVVDSLIIPTGWSPKEAGESLLRQLLERNGLGRGELSALVTTGYGRKAVTGADRQVTEITCHGKGAHFLAPSARTVLDIGGQDSKAILLDRDGSVEDFSMNDKCAAGTGRFLQMMSQALEYDLSDFGQVSPQGEVQAISSMCAVFAETEVVAHLARGVDRDSLVRGLLKSIASRSAAMLQRLGIREPVFFSGGVSRSPSLVAFLEQALGCSVLVSAQSQLAGALGAALIGWEGEKS